LDLIDYVCAKLCNKFVTPPLCLLLISYLVLPSNKLTNIMSKQSAMADATIDSHVLWAMGAGAIPIPFLDTAVVTAIQLNMFKELCMIYQSDYNESFGKNLITSIAGSTLATVGASALKAIPILGAFLGSAPMVVLSGASTYGMGQVFKKHLEIGGFLSNFSLENAKNIYNDAFEKGKGYVQDLWDQAKGFTMGKQAEPEAAPKDTPTNPAASPKTPSASDEVFSKLRMLGELRQNGVLTEEEFQDKKDKLLKEI
jgi:uncharacterized protein (DUF697 family)